MDERFDEGFDIDKVIFEEHLEAINEYDKAKHFEDIYGQDTPGYKIHTRLGNKHIQIAEWLEELKGFKSENE